MARTGGSHSGGRVGGSHSNGSRAGGSHTSPPRHNTSRPAGSSGPRPQNSFSHNSGPRARRHEGPPPGAFIPPPPPHHHHHHAAPPRRHRNNGSCLGSILAFILILVIIAIIFGSIQNSSQPESPSTTQTAAIERTPLADSLCKETNYYTDEQNMITDQNQLLTGLMTFYATTGVQPYVYFTATETLDDTYAGEVYDSLFSDEGHFLLLIHSTPDDQGDETWNDYYLLGTDAAKVIDNTLMDQFWQYYDTNYADINLTTEQVLSQTFSQTASVFTVSEKTPADTPAAKGSSKSILLIVGTVLLLLIIGIIFIVVRSRKTKAAGNATETEPDIFTQMNKERGSED